ncbi:MAG TPA: GNAT family N-acetyltransferase [Nocardioides sp.]|nr:GNAT family N-acetyltransferase [Nocardioides sp.]
MDDAPAMGRVMVEAWLAAHRGQMPDTLWQKRVEEWTPEVSAAAWARVLAEQKQGGAARVVILVAEEADEGRDPLALAMGDQDEEDASGSTAQVGALYVRPDHRGQGIGRALLGEAARELAALGFSALHISVLTLNHPARGFYEAMGGQELSQRTFDEEGVLLPETVYAWPDITTLAGDHTQCL